MNNLNQSEKGSTLPILAILVVAIVGILGYLILGKAYSQSLITQVSDLVSNQPLANETEVLPSSSATITITKDGFTPSTITVAKGQQVVWVNLDRSNHQIIEEQLELDTEVMASTDSFTYTFEIPGKYTLRDKLNLLTASSTVIVQ